MEKSYRIKANIGKDQFLNVNLKRDVDLYEVLSLKLSKEKIYKLHSSDYGVIVGRVLANDAFGVPNAKVSVFIPINDKDKLRSDIKALYPYSFVNSVDNNNVRFNTLPDYRVKKCHKAVGTFPSKRMVLDEDIKLEIYDKYYKFTTITNNAGDYMIFGVPVGEQMIHVDIDLSDIGVLSQRPTDLIYKGYDINLFESPVEFKKSTNLNELPQIITEDVSINVYPFWGNKDENEIAITRKDISVQYKFEPTCVFLGSVITDSSVNNISQSCTPSANIGEAGQLTTSEGTIEMIRKTIDDRIEEFSIKGNKLIDSDGVFCYQIPMNLDYVCTDEYGNIVPTDNPSKGIPTRTRVRFRVTLSETDNESLSSHKARYLIPNNPELCGGETKPFVRSEYLDESTNNGNFYEFGTRTNDECFRDLLWNKVYSVKNYIPRIQKQNQSKGEKLQERTGIKGVNKKAAGHINPLPFNKIDINFSIPAFQIIKQIWEDTKSIKTLWDFLNGRQVAYNIDAVVEKTLEDMDAIGLDFYNDWLNGCLYFPNWFWYLSTKKKKGNGDNKYDSEFCNCDEEATSDGVKLCVLNNCSLPYLNDELMLPVRDLYHSPSGYTQSENIYVQTQGITFFLHNKEVYGTRRFENGIIKRVVNKDGGTLFYYSFGQPCLSIDGSVEESKEKCGDILYKNCVRLFATDIILLGSLDSNDIHGIPKVSMNLPSTTSNIPPMGIFKPSADSEENEEVTDEEMRINKSSVNGMYWGQYWFNNFNGELIFKKKPTNSPYNSFLSSGLFFGMTYAKSLYYRNFKDRDIFLFKAKNSILPTTDIKTCINVERICELGVSNDSNINLKTDSGKEMKSSMDGLITKREIQDVDTRSLLATLNSDELICKVYNSTTGYKTYNLYFTYPTNFDGRLEEASRAYTNGTTNDLRNKDYLDYRFGSKSNIVRIPTRVPVEEPAKKRHFYGENGENHIIRDGSFIDYAFPLYNNSFYYYFGLNSGHNAIETFYDNFMPVCKEDEKEEFSISIEQSASTVCGENGIIKVSVSQVVLPYSLELKSDGYEKKYDDLFVEKTVEFTDLPNDTYTLTAKDAVGNIITKEITLKQRKISLDYNITSSILTKYNDNIDQICENEEYGIVTFNSYKNNGVITVIDSLSIEGSIGGNELRAKINNVSGITIIISVSDNESIGTYLCDPCFSGNELHIGKPGYFTVIIEEDECKSNFSETTFTMSDAGNIDMFINTVPLSFMLGNNNSYPSYFYTDSGYSNSTTVNEVRGWFGVHDPNTYSDDFNSQNAEEIWADLNSINGMESTILNKFNMLFNISNGAYVTNGSINKFNVIPQGGNSLLRAAYPKYEEMRYEESAGTFTSYITCNKGETNENGVNNSANIISENYRFPNSETKPIEGVMDFNPKYNNSKVCAGNYFAMFSNKANYIDECTKSSTGRKVKTIPYNADDLSIYNLCIGDDSFKDGILEKVYKQNPYFRTEFIDRRLDYDFIYVTPTESVDRSISDKVWSNGRLSGLTYNGIEMLYNDQYIIASNDESSQKYEYYYNNETNEVKCNNSSPKRLFKSIFKYGGSKDLDLRELYWSKVRTDISEETIGNDGIKVNNHSEDVNDNEFDNFGLSKDKNTILGYPTKRIVDIYNIPYGNGVYEWVSAGCKYPNYVTDYTNIKALSADEVYHRLDFKNPISIEINEVTYKVVADNSNNIFKANAYRIKFTVNSPSIEGLTTRIDNISLVADNDAHSKILAVKTGDINSAYYDMSIGDYTSEKTNPNGIDINKTDLTNDLSYIGVGIIYNMLNNTNDNLLKRIKVYNLSTFYNIKEMYFMPDERGFIETTGDGTEKLNFSLKTSSFAYNDVVSFNMSVRIGNSYSTYQLIPSPSADGIDVSVLLTGIDESIMDYNAFISFNLTIKNGLKYNFNQFEINNAGEIVI